MAERISMVRKHYLGVDLTGTGDNVFSWCPLAAGWKIHSIDINYGLVGSAVITDFEFVAAHNIAGYLFEVPDPESPPVNPNTMWDLVVPKADVFGGAFDIDPTTSDTDAFDAIGEVDLHDMLLGGTIKEIFARETMHSPAMNSIVNGSTNWRAIDRVSTRVKFKGGFTVRKPSVVMFGLASNDPTGEASHDLFTGTEQQWLPDSIVEWAGLMFPGMSLRMLVQETLGLFAADAERTDLLLSLFRWVEQALAKVNTAESVLTGFAGVLGGKITYHVSAPMEPQLQLAS